MSNFVGPIQRHLQALDADGHTCASGQAGFECIDQVQVRRVGGATVSPPCLEIAIDAMPLLLCVAQLDVTVRQLCFTAENFEAICDSLVVRAQTRQAGLTGRKMTYDGQAIMRKLRRDDGAHNQVEPRIAMGSDLRSKPGICIAAISKRLIRGFEYVNARECRKSIGIVVLYGSLNKLRPIEARGQQSQRVVDDCIEFKAEAIPLNQRKLGQMPLAQFAVAKHAAN